MFHDDGVHPLVSGAFETPWHKNAKRTGQSLIDLGRSMAKPPDYGSSIISGDSSTVEPPPSQSLSLENMWSMEAGTGTECDCPGPPPEFLLPPPPRPPILQSQDTMYCSEDPLPIETCDALPLIDASYRSSPSLQTSTVIILCSVLLGLAVFIAVILVWKHKRKVQHFLQCKTSPQSNREGPAAAGVVYQDLDEIIHRPPAPHHLTAGGNIVAPSIEMIDVKNNLTHFPSGYPISNHPPVFLCSSPGPDPYSSQDLYNPVYEELSDADSELAPAPHSEDEFAEDELSLGGEAERRLNALPQQPQYRGEHQRRTEAPRYRRPQEPLPPIPGTTKRQRSLDRRRQEFHEGMLLDALLQLYPRVGSVGPPNRRQIPSITQRLQCISPSPGPYETVPVLGHLATFRPVPKPYSQDSAFGSDSGYSNHTSCTRGSSRGRRDHRRLSQLSADLALT